MSRLGRTLGTLTAADIGRVVTFRDGGATYTGALRAAHHELGFMGRPPTTLVNLSAEEWRHIKSYPSDTPCDVDA